MAREFINADVEYLDVTAAPITAEPISMSIWFNSDNVGVNPCMFCVCQNGQNNYWSLWNLDGVGGGEVTAQARDTSGLSEAQSTTSWTDNTWHHCLGVFASDTDRRVYLDGGGKGTDSTSVSPTSIDTIAISRYRSASQNYDGSLAEAALWNVALTDEEALVLATGISPLMVRPQNLMFYAPLIRDTDEDIVGGLSLSAGGTPTVDTHPPIRYLAPPTVWHAPAAVAGETLLIAVTPGAAYMRQGIQIVG